LLQSLDSGQISLVNVGKPLGHPLGLVRVGVTTVGIKTHSLLTDNHTSSALFGVTSKYIV